jgi:hypothetical protein
VNQHREDAAVNRDGHHHSLQGWLLLVAVVALIAGPIVLYFLLPLAGMPLALASGVVAIVALKHLGLLAIVLAPLYAILRRLRRP